MPIYEYGCFQCLTFTELNIPIDKRDEKIECKICGGMRYRKISFTGSVYAPTATNGGMK